jgi:predicted transcriptional regulator
MTVGAQHGAPWDEKEDARLKSFLADDVRRQDIAKLLGRTQEAVNARIRKIAAERMLTPKARKAQKRRQSGASFFLS